MIHTVLDGLTISAPIKRGREAGLTSLLEAMGLQEKCDAVLPFFQLKTLHFASCVIIPETKDSKGNVLPARLAIMTTYNGKLSTHIRVLAEICGEGLHQLFCHCEGYHCPGNWDSDSLVQFMKKHRISNTLYPAYQYLTPDEINQEEHLRKSIEGFLDAQMDSIDSKNPEEIRSRIQKFVSSQPDLAWAAKPYKVSLANQIHHYGPLVGITSAFAILVILSILAIFWPNVITLSGASILGAFILFAGVLVLGIRLNENLPPDAFEKATDDKIREIVHRETKPVCNEMTVSGPIKSGGFRPTFLRSALWFINFLRPLIFIPTVHTARWAAMDQGRRIVFIAYFDNTSGAYAHDFVDSTRRTRNLNLLLGHGMGFPETRWLVGGGGKDRNQYMEAVRGNQHVTQIWYHTHPELSILNLKLNHEIRKGLHANMSREEITAWLEKF